MFVALYLAAGKVSSASVVSAIEDTEVLGHFISNGESKASGKNFDSDSASSFGQGISASQRSLAQTQSLSAPAADGPFLYTSSCPVPLDDCVLPTTDYFEPLASWKLRSGHSFAQMTSTGAATDHATNCCLCDIAKICFSDNGEYIGAQAIGDKFPDYEYILSGWCYALQDHYNELFTAKNSTDDNNDGNELVSCRWFDDDNVKNSTVIEGISGNMMASPGTVTPVDQIRVMTVARSPGNQPYRADSEEDNDFETYISKLVSEQVVATSSEDTVVDDEQGVSSEDDEIDSNEDVVQSDSAESSDGNVTTSDRDSDSSRDDDAVDDDGGSDSKDSTGDDDSTVVDGGNKSNSDDSDSDSIVEDDDNNDNGGDSIYYNGDDNVDHVDDDEDINDDGDGEDSSDVSSDSDDGEAPTTAPTSAPTPAPTTQGADSVRIVAVQGVATFEDLQVEEFSTDERNNFISTLADNANVDASFVRILLVSPGSVVVCWAVAFPEETTLSKKELAVLLSPNLDASLVR